jgi:X-X-X-Leu-X-X-Gly heptad repeat protein
MGGSAQFAGGLGELSTNAASLLDGSAQIKDALSKLSSALDGAQSPDETSPGAGPGMDGLLQLPDALDQTASGLSDLASGLQQLKDGWTPAYAALRDAIDQIPSQTPSRENIAALYAANPDKKDLIDTLVGYYRGGAATKAAFEATRQAFAAVDTSLADAISGAEQLSQALTSMSAPVSRT